MKSLGFSLLPPTTVDSYSRSSKLFEVISRGCFDQMWWSAAEAERAAPEKWAALAMNAKTMRAISALILGIRNSLEIES